MPTVDVHPDELRRLTGHGEKSNDELRDDLFALGLEYEGETADGAFELEFAPDRLDRLAVTGIARSLQYQYGDRRGVYVPDTNDPEWTVRVEDVPESRPYVTGFVARDADLDEDALDAVIQLQEKLHATMGRKRAKGAIGIHDLTMLKGSARGDAGHTITYTGVAPEGDTFVPLDSDAEMTPAEVLDAHATGREYADLVADGDRYPAIYDDIGLFSFPPVINGRRTEVDTDSRDLLVELTGTDQWTIDRMGVIVAYALDARGATVEDVTVAYPDRELRRPDLSVDTKRLAHERVERTLGVDFDAGEVTDLLERSGLDATAVETDGERAYDVDVPPYRVDVLHPVDLVDDVGRAYGFNDLVPRYPEVGTVGGRTEAGRHERAVRQRLVGLGFEDLLNFHLASESGTFDAMRLSPGADVLGGGEPARISEPYSEAYGVLRTWALPSVLQVLANNTHRAYPQDLADVGFTARRDPGEPTGVAERTHVAAALARHDASYEDAKAHLRALADAFDTDLATPPTEHPSFIDGRTAAVVLGGEDVGVVGELHPAVLVDHGLEVPVAAFEFPADALR